MSETQQLPMKVSLSSQAGEIDDDGESVEEQISSNDQRGEENMSKSNHISTQQQQLQQTQSQQTGGTIVVTEQKKELKSALQSIKLKQKLGNFINQTSGRRYQMLEKVNFKMLNDLSVITHDTTTRSSAGSSSSATGATSSSSPNSPASNDVNDQNSPSLLEKLSIMFPPFNPSSRFKLWWDILQMMITIAILFFLPIHLVFQISLLELMPEYFLRICIPISIALDILVSLNTAKFLKGVLSRDRKLILQNYLHNNFKYDAIGCGPLLIYLYTGAIDISPTDNYEYARFTILSYFYKVFFVSLLLLVVIYFTSTNDKVVQFGHVFKQVEDVFPLSTYTSNVISLIKLLFSIIFNLHISALVWLFVAFVQLKQDKNNTWMTAAGINSEDWQTQYVYSYYFSTVTMITVGYGDISPRSVLEKLVSVLNMMIACGQFAYSVNSIGNIFAQFFKQSNEIKANMYVINNYMSTKNISKDLQYQIREYLDYYWKEEKSSNTDMEAKILEQLSQKLRDTLLMEANKIALRDSPIFNMNFSDQIVLKTLPLIEELRCTPEEIIYYKGDSDDSSIFFIEKGCVEAFTYQRTPFNKKMRTINPLYTMGPGQFFGSFNFFTGQSREINMRSNEFTTLLKVKRADFLNLLKDYPDDYEVFCMIRDRAIYSSELHQISSKCQCCNKSDHLLPLCPLIHFVPQKFSIIRQFSQGSDHRRAPFHRAAFNKFRTLKSRVLAEEKLTQFVIDSSDEVRLYYRKYFIEISNNNSYSSFNSTAFDDEYDDNEEDDDEDQSNTSQSSNSSQNQSQNQVISNDQSQKSLAYVNNINNNNNGPTSELEPTLNALPPIALPSPLPVNYIIHEPEQSSQDDFIEQEGSVTVNPSCINDKIFHPRQSQFIPDRFQVKQQQQQQSQQALPLNNTMCSVSSQLIYSIHSFHEGEENLSMNSLKSSAQLPKQLHSNKSAKHSLKYHSKSHLKKNSIDKHNQASPPVPQSRKSLFDAEARQQDMKPNNQQCLQDIFAQVMKNGGNNKQKQSPQLRVISKLRHMLKASPQSENANKAAEIGLNSAMSTNNPDFQELIKKLLRQLNPEREKSSKYDIRNIGKLLLHQQQQQENARRDAHSFQPTSNQQTELQALNMQLLQQQQLLQLQQQQLLQFMPKQTDPNQNDLLSHVPRDQLDDAMHIYKFFYPQHNVVNIIENLNNKKKAKKEVVKKTLENKIMEGLKDNLNIRQRLRNPMLAQQQGKGKGNRQSIPNVQRQFTGSSQQSQQPSQGIQQQSAGMRSMQTSGLRSTTNMVKKQNSVVSEKSSNSSHSSLSCGINKKLDRILSSQRSAEITADHNKESLYKDALKKLASKSILENSKVNEADDNLITRNGDGRLSDGNSSGSPSVVMKNGQKNLGIEASLSSLFQRQSPEIHNNIDTEDIQDKGAANKTALLADRSISQFFPPNTSAVSNYPSFSGKLVSQRYSKQAEELNDISDRLSEKKGNGDYFKPNDISFEK